MAEPEAPAGALAHTGGQALRRIVYSEQEIARPGLRRWALPSSRRVPDRDEDLLVLGLLKGSFIFLADLVRYIARPLHVDFLMAASYGSGTVSSGDVRLVYDAEADVRGKHVLLVEDIIDSGNTINRLVPLLERREPKSLELCALLHKRIAPALAREARWVGFDAPQEFLIGYGLDHSENFRNLPFIASL
jgi:hypoxanthine phosphoribosyltransferase